MNGWSTVRFSLLVMCVTPAPARESAPKEYPTEASSTIDPAAWLEDFHQILSAMASHYANLEWAVQDRKMNLPQLRLDTETKLRGAVDDLSAKRILDQFLATFGDGHLVIDWPVTGARALPSHGAEDLCTRIGYVSRLRPGVEFSRSPAFTDVQGPESRFFPGGVLRLRNKTVVGVIRIGLFSEHSYPETCRQAVKDLHLPQDTRCSDKCQDSVQLATANLLTSALTRRAEELRAAGATTLLVDVTHNGGGSDWVEAPPRALSSVPLHDARMAFVRAPLWTNELQDRLHAVETDLTPESGRSAPLEQAHRLLEKAVAESKKTCDASAVWVSGWLDCSLVVQGLLFASGEIDYAKPGSLQSLSSRTVLFQPSQYSYAEDTHRLPLYVLVDRETWSAAEYFAAILQDNHAAIVLGELTGGAGCGYTNGGIATTLRNSGGVLRMPDCVRFRADGSNEVNGVTPDILLPFAARDSEHQRLVKVIAALAHD